MIGVINHKIWGTVERSKYPYPFNPSTTIEYSLPGFGQVELSIYSAVGQLLRVLVNRSQPAGMYSVRWDGRDADGRAVASGVYLAHLRTREFQQLSKLLLLR